MLVDGFNAAEILKAESPEDYKLLSKVLIPAHSAGEEDVFITPTMPLPVFTHHFQTGELTQVRWNNDDRSTMDDWEDPEDVPRYYSAIRHWYDILTRKENELVFPLGPGKVLCKYTNI